jgi:superfamily II DNA helicase RecQ
MAIKFFSVPALAAAEAEAELNQFLRTHRVVTTTRELVSGSGTPVWCIAVEYLDGTVAGVTGDQQGRRNKIDYREVLAPADFVRFSKLRELRKKFADEEAIPVYTVFTNEQLAVLATKQPKTAAELQQVDGVGEAKAKKYAERVLALLAAMNGATNDLVAPS